MAFSFFPTLFAWLTFVWKRATLPKNLTSQGWVLAKVIKWNYNLAATLARFVWLIKHYCFCQHCQRRFSWDTFCVTIFFSVTFLWGNSEKVLFLCRDFLSVNLRHDASKSAPVCTSFRARKSKGSWHKNCANFKWLQRVPYRDEFEQAMKASDPETMHDCTH